MKTQILYTTRKPKPQPTPTPANAPAPESDRMTIDWGAQGRLHLSRSKAPESDRQQQPKREVSGIGRPIPLETPRIQAGQVERSSKLERIRRPKPLWEELAERSSDFRVLEYLAVLRVGDCEYAIAEQETGENFVNQVFETREHCAAAAFEVEQVFDMVQVLETRLTDTMEKIDELVEWHYLKEWVALGLT